VAHALGAAMAKRLDAWLRAGANPPPAGFTPVSLRPGWTCLTAMPPAPTAGASPLRNPAAAPLVRAYPDPPAKAGRGRTALTAPFNTVEHTVTGGHKAYLMDLRQRVADAVLHRLASYLRRALLGE
jgi:hypothetical protein